jgi:hypothetical protein
VVYRFHDTLSNLHLDDILLKESRLHASDDNTRRQMKLNIILPHDYNYNKYVYFNII